MNLFNSSACKAFCARPNIEPNCRSSQGLQQCMRQLLLKSLQLQFVMTTVSANCDHCFPTSSSSCRASSLLQLQMPYSSAYQFSRKRLASMPSHALSKSADIVHTCLASNSCQELQQGHSQPFTYSYIHTYRLRQPCKIARAMLPSQVSLTIQGVWQAFLFQAASVARPLSSDLAMPRIAASSSALA